jgi:hypothetical protein
MEMTHDRSSSSAALNGGGGGSGGGMDMRSINSSAMVVKASDIDMEEEDLEL